MAIPGAIPDTDRLLGAASPDDLFGPLAGTPVEQLARLRQQYRQLALAVHPDRHPEDPSAHRAFLALQQLYLLAQEQIRDGQYGAHGPSSGAVVLETRRRRYVVGDLLAEGDLANLYIATATDRRAGPTVGHVGAADVLLKVTRDSQDNDLLVNEARTLRHLALTDDGSPAPIYLPRLLESFTLQGDANQNDTGTARHDGASVARQVNAFPPVATERGPLPATSFYSLAEVRAAYPGGVDPKQMAWIWRRLLIALGYAHQREIVHGAVLPTHVLVQPEAHGLLLVDWCASVHQPRLRRAGLPFVSTAYEAWYPPPVLVGGVPSPTTDLEMGLRCMVDLLGGDPRTGALPGHVPAPLRAYLRAALRTAAIRPDAGRLYRDFSDLLARLWGQRRFVPFAMPPRP